MHQPGVTQMIFQTEGRINPSRSPSQTSGPNAMPSHCARTTDGVGSAFIIGQANGESSVSLCVARQPTGLQTPPVGRQSYFHSAYCFSFRRIRRQPLIQAGAFHSMGTQLGEFRTGTSAVSQLRLRRLLTAICGSAPEMDCYASTAFACLCP